MASFSHLTPLRYRDQRGQTLSLGLGIPRQTPQTYSWLVFAKSFVRRANAVLQERERVGGGGGGEEGREGERCIRLIIHY